MQAFVDKEGDKMGYTVAADASGDVGRLMSRANVTGIPHAFVVGRDGKILYRCAAWCSFVQTVNDRCRLVNDRCRLSMIVYSIKMRSL